MDSDVIGIIHKFTTIMDKNMSNRIPNAWAQVYSTSTPW